MGRIAIVATSALLVLGLAGCAAAPQDTAAPPQPSGSPAPVVGGDASAPAGDPEAAPQAGQTIATSADGLARCERTQDGWLLATPCYTLALPADSYPDGVDFTYDDATYVQGADESLQNGRMLSVGAAGSGMIDFFVECVTQGWTGGQGSFATAEAGELAGQPGWRVIVCKGVIGEDADAAQQVVDDIATRVTVTG